MASHNDSLGIVDYVLFGVMLMISTGIGIYFRFSGEKQKTAKEYLLAGKNMSILPVAFSLMASYLSAITIVGIPAEMYYFGIYLVYLNISFTVGSVIAAFLTLPVFFEMQATTAYEYLEVRFGKIARMIASFSFIAQMILFMSVVLYAPALALSAVTNLSTWVSVISVGAVCTFYCTIGGMKAVLWTDVFQSVLMFLGIIAVIIVGLLDLGFESVYKRAKDGGRIVIPKFDLSPYTRYTAWNIIIQGIILSTSAYGVNQVQIQRLLTVKTLSRSRKALFLNIPLSAGFHFLTCLAGVIIYAYFAHCDPMTSPNNPITKRDQLLPYFMMVRLGDYPGLPGLCICGIFSASLSTISSAINSLSAVTMQDLVRPFLEAKGVSQINMMLAAQATTLFFGSLCVALTFLVAHFGNLVQASITVFGILGGPVLGIFLLGMLTIRANEKGSVTGMIVGTLMSAWIGFGGSANAPRPKILPTSIDGCLILNSTATPSSFTSTILPSTYSGVDYSNVSQLFIAKEAMEIINSQWAEEDKIFPLYRISFMWLTPIGFFVTYIVGYTASFMINIITGKTKDVSQELISPVIKRFILKRSDLEKENSINIDQIQRRDSREAVHCPVSMETGEIIKRNITESSSL